MYTLNQKRKIMKNKLNLGDLLYRSKLFVEHAGIYLGSDRVLHNSPDGNVQICTLDEYSAGKPIKVILNQLSKEKQNELLHQAEQLISQAKHYGILSFNCEHLASSVLSGSSTSEQLQGVGLGAAAGLLLAYSNKSKYSFLFLLAGGLIGCMAVNASRKYDFSI
ncbi:MULTISPECIES: lecithin retinol acyltransferase family protein [Aliivibrio]|uniref:lecithin retinol acyltransferase family protein n=1 Tax=Aliivibrio TaxID=511678 RepID=UPI0021576E39|nr:MULTISPECIES: NlpC/P60 family protein [Aliivibrio]MDD9180414.1 NlpC/P60 family protein [Aliivibrio sp. A6]